jgi:hypothetical protein
MAAVCGLGLLLMTAITVIQADPHVVATLELLSNFLPGYEATGPGCLVGLAYGAALGFALGWTLALVRNGVWFLYFSLIRRRAERSFLRDFLDYI